MHKRRPPHACIKWYGHRWETVRARDREIYGMRARVYVCVGCGCNGHRDLVSVRMHTVNASFADSPSPALRILLVCAFWIAEKFPYVTIRRHWHAGDNKVRSSNIEINSVTNVSIVIWLTDTTTARYNHSTLHSMDKNTRKQMMDDAFDARICILYIFNLAVVLPHSTTA